MQCARCSRPAALACGACKMSPVLDGDTAITHYCSAACQKADWSSHKPICQRLKDRTTLYRVSQVAQQLFYMYQEITWGLLDVQAVDKTEDELILRGQINPNFITWPRDYKVFPSHLFPTALNRPDREATLSYRGCLIAATWMIEFVEGMLKRIVRKVTQIEVRTKNDIRRTTMPEPGVFYFSGGVRHEVLKLELRSGEVFAVDLSGAQFGYHEPVTRWDSYEDNRTSEILRLDIAPPPSKVLQADDFSIERHIFLYQKMQQPKERRVVIFNTLEAINLNLVEWQAGEKVSLKSLWTMREEEYQKKSQNLVDYIEWIFHSISGRPWYTKRGRELRAQLPVTELGGWVFGRCT